MLEAKKQYVPGSIAVQFRAGVAKTEAEKVLVDVGASFFGGYVKRVLYATVPAGSEEEIVRVLLADVHVAVAQRNVDLNATFPDWPGGCGAID